jgi:hypothetical protein
MVSSSISIVKFSDFSAVGQMLWLTSCWRRSVSRHNKLFSYLLDELLAVVVESLRTVSFVSQDLAL